MPLTLFSSSAKGHRFPTVCGVILAFFLVALPARADESGPPPPSEPADEKTPEHEDDTVKPIEWGPKGLDIRSRDGNYHAHIDWRAQLRFTQSNLGEELVPNPETREGEFAVNRARFKMGGHAYRPWLVYYLEFDFVGGIIRHQLQQRLQETHAD